MPCEFSKIHGNPPFVEYCFDRFLGFPVWLRHTNQPTLGVQVLLSFRSIPTVDLATHTLSCFVASDGFVSTSSARHAWNDAEDKQARELAGDLSHRLSFARHPCHVVHYCPPPILSPNDGLCTPQPKITHSRNSGHARRVCITRHGVHLSLHHHRGHQQSIAKCLLTCSRASSSNRTHINILSRCTWPGCDDRVDTNGNSAAAAIYEAAYTEHHQNRLLFHGQRVLAFTCQVKNV